MQEPEIASFFDPDTFTVTHIVSDPATTCAAIIDSVLDYDPKSGRTSHDSADKVIKHVQQKGLTVAWLLETHAHADHLSAASYLKEKLGGTIAIGRHICDVQGVFKKVFNLKELNTQGTEFDQLFDDGEAFKLGSLDVHVMHTPGHTPACLTYIVGKHAFIGDTLFMPDYGSARCDFPGGDAATLYQSIKKVLSLAPDTLLHLCHDYPPKEREPAWVSSIAEQRTNNIHVHDGVTEAEFVKMRTARDKTLSMPVLILPAIQVNIRAGCLPAPEDNGVAYLKIPVNAL
jgi:glyoxylase-like metal-dependent hydrolase (beta-lactamase superfamily II)